MDCESWARFGSSVAGSWISGQRRVFLNLCAGLDRVGIPYRVNDYSHIQKHPEELACILGRPFVLDWFAWKNPLLLGVVMFNHPIDVPERLKEFHENTILVPPKVLSIETAMEWIDQDELVEVSPTSVQVRKKILDCNKRPRREEAGS